MKRSLSYPALLAALVALPACVEQPEKNASFQPVCEVDADCDQAEGEICDEGVCWGGPPTTVFAAILSPPAEREDLAVTELTELTIREDGTITNLEFGPSMVVSGRVLLACSDVGEPFGCGEESSVSARISFERPSRIPGGPVFKRTVDAKGGMGRGDTGFQVRLPALVDGERYEVTVTPDSTTIEGTTASTAASFAPPLRRFIEPGDEVENLEWSLGEPETMKVLEGRVRTEFSPVGQGVAGMQVFARGRWTSDGAWVRASNLVTTGTDGAFVLRVPVGMQPDLRLVARPTGDLVTPVLERSMVVADPVEPGIDAPVTELADLLVPPAPNPAPYVVTIVGTTPAGEEVRVAGAQVSLSTSIDAAAGDPTTVAVYSASGTTTDTGTVELMLFPGSNDTTRPYQLQVVPPQDSLSATVFAKTVEVAAAPGSGRGFLQNVVLSPRIPLSGTLLSATGAPVVEASVTVSASKALRAILDTVNLNILDSLAFPTALSASDGGFVLWIDPAVGTIPAIYDLELAPPADSGAPRWSQDTVEVGGVSAGPLSLGTVQLPPASFARGVVEGEGSVVVGAEIRVFEILSNEMLCEQLELPGADGCSPTARLRGLWRSDEEGWFRIAIPDPDDR